MTDFDSKLLLFLVTAPCVAFLLWVLWNFSTTLRK